MKISQVFGIVFLVVFLCNNVWSVKGIASCDSIQQPCDPLVPEYCMLPYPNDYYKCEKDTLHLPQEAMPADKFGERINPDQLGLNAMDGFSGASVMVSYWENLSVHNIPAHWDIGASLKKDSPTVLLDYESGQLLAHWAELDVHVADDPRHALMLWPAQHMGNARRIIVAMRSLQQVDANGKPGKLYDPSPAFKALRDNTTSPLVSEQRRAHFQDIFGALEKAGIDRNTLQLAWDFTTGSVQSVNGRALHMRDVALSQLPKQGPDYTIENVIENPQENTRRRIEGTISVPSFLSSKLPGSHLVLDKKGVPVYQKNMNFNFTVQIPNSLVNNGTTGAIFQYGHGLFGSQSELHQNYIQDMGNQYGWVQAGVNWIGMANFDVPSVSLMCLTNLSDFSIIPDRLTQAMVNQQYLTQLLMSDRFIHDPNMMFNGKPVINPNLRFYDGNSNGGILGCSFMALTQDIERGVLGVPGAPYNLLLFRSVDFIQFYELIVFRYPNPVDQVNIMNVIQSVWERASPGGYVNHLVKDPLPDTPSKRVLWHYGLGDAQVSWLGAEFMARTGGAQMFANNPPEGNETFYGFQVLQKEVVQEGTLLQAWNFGADLAPGGNIPPNKATDTHECVRRDPRAQEQMAHFFKTGEIKDFCGNLGDCQPLDPPIHLKGCPLPDYK